MRNKPTTPSHMCSHTLCAYIYLTQYILSNFVVCNGEKISSSIPWPLTNGIMLGFPWKNQTKSKQIDVCVECIRTFRRYQETLQYLVDCISMGDGIGNGIGLKFDLIVRVSCGDRAHYDWKMHSFLKNQTQKKVSPQTNAHSNHGPKFDGTHIIGSSVSKSIHIGAIHKRIQTNTADDLF